MLRSASFNGMFDAESPAFKDDVDRPRRGTRTVVGPDGDEPLAADFGEKSSEIPRHRKSVRLDEGDRTPTTPSPPDVEYRARKITRQSFNVDVLTRGMIGMKSDLDTLLTEQSAIRREVHDVNEQVAKLHEMMANGSATMQPSTSRLLGSPSFAQQSSVGSVGRVNEEFTLDGAFTAEPSMVSPPISPRGIRGSSDGKLRQHARSLRASKRTRIGMVASSLPIGWPVTVEMRPQFGLIPLREPGDRQLLVEACRLGHTQVLGITAAMGSAVSLAAEEDPKRNRRCPSFILHPTSAVRLIVDIISLFVLAYDLLVTPYVLAFDLQDQKEFVLGSFATLCFWALSVPMNLRSGFFKDGEVEMRAREIARHYAHSWMIPDVTLVVTDSFSMATLVFAAGGDAGDTKYAAAFTLLRFSRIGRLLRLLGFIRMARFTAVLLRVADFFLSSTAKTMVETLGFVFVLLWVNHLISCAWVAIGLGASSDTKAHWVDAIVLESMDIGSYREQPEAFQYTTALHWAITQMSPGSMQVNPLNTNERFFAVICLVLGILCSGSIVSTLTAKMMQMMIANQDFNRKLNLLRRFLRQKNVSHSMAVQVQKMVVDRLSTTRLLTSQDVHVLDYLSLGLRALLQEELCRPRLISYPIFRVLYQVDSALVRQLCSTTVDFVVLPVEDNLFLAGSEASKCYLVVDGDARYVQVPESSMVTEQTEHSVGEGRWICEASLWTLWTHVGTFEAKTIMELMRINAEQLVTVLRKNQVVATVAAEYCHSFVARLTTAMPPVAHWPHDLNVPFTDYSEIILSMSTESRTLVGLLAMSTLKTSSKWRFAWARVVDRLNDELSSGRSTYVHTAKDEIEKVVATLSINVQDIENRSLLQLGYWDETNKRVEASCRLVGTTLQAGEQVSDGLHRLLLVQLSPFKKLIKISCPELDISTTMDRSGIATKHLNAVYPGVIEVSIEDELCKGEVSRSATLMMASASPVAIMHRQSSAAARSVSSQGPREWMSTSAANHGLTGCFVLQQSGSQSGDLMICAWVDFESVDYWKSPANRSILQHQLESIFHTPQDIEAAKQKAANMEVALARSDIGDLDIQMSRFDNWVPATMVPGLADVVMNDVWDDPNESPTGLAGYGSRLSSKDSSIEHPPSDEVILVNGQAPVKTLIAEKEKQRRHEDVSTVMGSAVATAQGSEAVEL